MPIYEYRCESCGDKFEKLVRRSTDVMECGCPACGGKHLEQQYSTFAARGDNGADHSFTPAATRMGEGGMCGGGGCGGGMCGQN
jgi:putative FmdB family regulatory protein